MSLCRSICNPYMGTLSSYAYILLVVFFCKHARRLWYRVCSSRPLCARTRLASLWLGSTARISV